MVAKPEHLSHAVVEQYRGERVEIGCQYHRMELVIDTDRANLICHMSYLCKHSSATTREGGWLTVSSSINAHGLRWW